MRKKGLLTTAAILLVLMLSTGCGNQNTGTVSPSSTPTPSAQPSAEPSSSVSPAEDTQKMILDAFQALLSTPGNEKTAITAMRQDASKLTPENADQLILNFEAYQKEAVTKGAVVSGALVDLIQKFASEPYDERILNDLSQIANLDLKNALQAVFDKGYKLIVPEGNYEAVINYAVYEDAAVYGSPDIAAYIEIMARESSERMSEDAAIRVTIDEVFARALRSERFIKAYPDSFKIDQVKERYTIYLFACFFGQDNTPAFDYATGKLDQEFLDSYKKAAESGTDSAIVKATGEYLQVLEDNGYTLTAAVTEYRKAMTDKLKAVTA